MTHSINNLQEFKTYCQTKGNLIQASESNAGYFASFSNTVKKGFTINTDNKLKGVYRTYLSKKDYNNELVLKF